LKINKTNTEIFLDYAYTRNTDLFDKAKDFIVTFYSTIKTANINNFIIHTIKDKEIQLYLIYLLRVDPDERNIQEIVKLFDCNVVPKTKEVKVVSTLTPYSDLDLLNLSLKTRAECIESIFTLAYQIKEFGEEVIGHSLMLFDRFIIRTKGEIDDPKLYAIISMFISSSIMKGELIKGTYIKKILQIKYNKEYFLEDIRMAILNFIEYLDFKLFNFSPDILYNFTKPYEKLLELSIKYPFINDNAYELFKLLK
jgi:hypothetical protein